jgi:hypothetical protein
MLSRSSGAARDTIDDIVTRTQHRTRRTVVDLHHVLGQDDQSVTEHPVHVHRPQPHPSSVRGGAAVLVTLVLVSSSTFWALLWWDDGTRQAFFPRRGPGTLVMAILFAWGLLTQIVGPLRIIRALQMTGRLRIALSLRMVVEWTATSLGTIAWWLASRDISGWFALLAGLLVLPAFGLYQLVRTAVRADR